MVDVVKKEGFFSGGELSFRSEGYSDGRFHVFHGYRETYYSNGILIEKCFAKHDTDIGLKLAHFWKI